MQIQPHIVSMETLKGCRKGLTRRIKQESKPENKKRLRDIRNEIDFLIENL